MPSPTTTYQNFYKRWFKIPLIAATHPQLRAWRESRAQHNVIYAGRRSYKTEYLKRKLVKGTPYVPGALTREGNYFYAAPTYQQAKRIAWKDLKALTLPFQKGSPSESELVIRLRNGSDIYLIGMDKPERIEGMQWHGGGMDEYANMKSSAWPEHVQPVTSDTGAWVDFIGVPEGRNHFYDLTEEARDYPDWWVGHWKSAEVIPAYVIEKAQRTLDPRSFRQEYEASFESATVEAYYCFSDASLCDVQYNPQLESWLCWDFNAGEKPMSCVLVQSLDTRYVVVKDWSIPFTNTESMCEIVADWLKVQGHTGKLEITGDYAGKRRESSAAFSDYEIIETYFKHHRGFRVKTRPTLKVKDRVQSVNRMLKTADGRQRLFISRACDALVTDIRKTAWKENGVELDQDSDPKRTHLTDALSYWAYNYHPADKAERTINVN